MLLRKKRAAERIYTKQFVVSKIFMNTNNPHSVTGVLMRVKKHVITGANFIGGPEGGGERTRFFRVHNLERQPGVGYLVGNKAIVAFSKF